LFLSVTWCLVIKTILKINGKEMGNVRNVQVYNLSLLACVWTGRCVYEWTSVVCLNTVTKDTDTGDCDGDSLDDVSNWLSTPKVVLSWEMQSYTQKKLLMGRQWPAKAAEKFRWGNFEATDPYGLYLPEWPWDLDTASLNLDSVAIPLWWLVKGSTTLPSVWGYDNFHDRTNGKV
jgi:hypothetical protein